MTLSDEVRETFREATLQREAARGLNGHDWARYREIQDVYEKRQRQECRDYENEYPTRVEVARKQVIDEAAKKALDLIPRFFGADKFAKDAINRQAHRRVQNDHSRTLARLKAGKEADIKKLLAAAVKRQELGNVLLQDFSRAVDRRSGSDRRRGPLR